MTTRSRKRVGAGMSAGSAGFVVSAFAWPTVAMAALPGLVAMMVVLLAIVVLQAFGRL